MPTNEKSPVCTATAGAVTVCAPACGNKAKAATVANESDALTLPRELPIFIFAETCFKCVRCVGSVVNQNVSLRSHSPQPFLISSALESCGEKVMETLCDIQENDFEAVNAFFFNCSSKERSEGETCFETISSSDGNCNHRFVI